jgi:hypothetical protein
MKTQPIMEWYKEKVETLYPGKGEIAVALVNQHADEEFRGLLKMEAEQNAYVARPDAITLLCKRQPALLTALRGLK